MLTFVALGIFVGQLIYPGIRVRSGDDRGQIHSVLFGLTCIAAKSFGVSATSNAPLLLRRLQRRSYSKKRDKTK